jgi:hypothetical protein
VDASNGSLLRLHRALFSSTLSSARSGFFVDWFNIVSARQAQQPHWITPLATTTPRLEQEFRYDIQGQTHNRGLTTDNDGVSLGFRSS